MIRNNRSRLSRRLLEKDGNCFLYGCGALVVFTIVATAAISFLVIQSVNELKEKYTDVEPIELPVMDLAEEEQEALLSRVDTYYEQLKNDEATEPLVLDQNDINGIIQYHPEFEKLSDKVYFTLDGDRVSGQVSVPLDGLPTFGGRYFNGTADFDVAFEDGIGKVFVLDASLNGEPIPQEALDEVGRENLASEMQNDPETQEVMSKIETIEVIDSQVVITPKGLAEESSELVE